MTTTPAAGRRPARPSRIPGLPSRALGVTAAAALTFTGLAALGPVPAAAAADSPAVHVADPDADAQTRSLFQYLLDEDGRHALFGQQHAIDESVSASTTGPDGQPVKSDVYALTGTFPGLFGFDGLALTGDEKPGSQSSTGEQNADALAAQMVRADALGGVVTLSSHMPNFVTGGSFDDTSGGDVVARILPGGDANAKLTAYLDLVARAAQHAQRADGSLVPIIYRPFHENTGGWFWWGAGHASTGEFKELFRYTVEYLRDVLGVHNLLYVFSPNGTFGGDSARYLDTYPGDQWVDVLGYDNYQGTDTEAGTDAFVQASVQDLAMVARVAAQHHKVPAMTEFGRNGDATIKTSGNTSTDFFTKLLAGIKADPDASKIAYMLTWANFGSSQIYVPYPGHEMADDFLAYADDPYTVFSDGTGDPFGLATTVAPQEPLVRLVTPADGVRVTSASTTVRAKVTGADASAVTFWSGDDESGAVTLTHGADGYWSGTWDVGAANLTNKTVAVHVRATVAGADPLTADAHVVLGEPPTFAEGVVDDFEGYGDDAALRAAYTVSNAASSAISLTPRGSGHAVDLHYDLDANGYLGFGKSYATPQNWSGFGDLEGYVGADGSGEKLVWQLATSDGTFEAYPSLAADAGSTVTVPWSDWVPAPWDSAHAGATLTPQRLASVTGFSVYLNEVTGAAHAGDIVLDDLEASGTGDRYDPPSAGTTAVDDFESYADDAALRAVWGNRGKTDLLTLSDDAAHGQHALAFAYDYAANGTWIDVSRSVSGSWAGKTGLTLSYRGDGSGNQLAIQVGTSAGKYWLTTLPLTSTGWKTVTIPFASLSPSWPADLTGPMTDADLAAVSELVLAASSGSGTADGAGASHGTIGVDDVAVTGGSTTPTIPDGTAETLDTFDAYRTTDEARAAWNNIADQSWGDGWQLSLAPGKGDGGSNAGAFAYDFTSTTYQQESRWLGGQSWAGLDGVTAWVDPNGSDQTLSFRVRTPSADGTGDDWYWDLTVPLGGGTGGRLVHLPFDQAVVTYPNGLDPSLRPTRAQLAKVNELIIMASQSDASAPKTGTFYLDDLSVGAARAPAAPAVTTQPASATVADGATATFTAAASGYPTPTVQWQARAPKASTWADVAGATSGTLTVPAAYAKSGTAYRAVFTNATGSATSDAATLTVTATKPAITTQPASATVSWLSAARFSVTASGTGPLRYQWQLRLARTSVWLPVPGATGSTLALPALLVPSGSQVRVVVTNPAGSTASAAATLTVRW